MSSRLLHEEKCCLTQAPIEQKGITFNTFDFACETLAETMDVSKVQSYSLKEYGHVVDQCKKYYNYYKKACHLIAESQKRPRNRASCAVHVGTNDSSSSAHVCQRPP